MNKWFNVGKIVNTHGIHGEVRVISVTDFAEQRYKNGNNLYLFNKANETSELTVTNHRRHKNFDLLTFAEFSNVNEVEWMKGLILKVPADQLEELEDGEFYFHEIIGCVVQSSAGEKIGEITEILTPGANDVWVVKRPNNETVYIPYIDDVVKNIDIENKLITIEIIEGLLE